MIALKIPNLTAVGEPYDCLIFTDAVLGVPGKYASAWEAWEATEFHHDPSEPLPDVPVPVWFSWTGTVNGVTKNWGHVAVWIPGKGVLSSPFNYSIPRQWFVTPDALVRYLGSGSYVGWSEDINGVRVAITTKEDDMTTQDATALLDSFFWNFLGRKVKQSELDEYTPFFLQGEPDKFFKKAAQFDEVKVHMGGQALSRDTVLGYLQSNLR